MALCGDGCAVKRSGRAQAPHAPGRSGFWARGGGWVLAQIPVLIGAVMVPSQTADSFSLIGVPAHIIGIAITVTGGIIVLAGALQLGEALTPLPHPRDGARLREEGIYRYMRHPIYSGLIVGSFGWALAADTLSCVQRLCAESQTIFPGYVLSQSRKSRVPTAAR